MQAKWLIISSTSSHPAPTLPETNIAPGNGPSQKETSIPTIHFSGAILVSGRVIDQNPKHHIQDLLPFGSPKGDPVELKFAACRPHLLMGP